MNEKNKLIMVLAVIITLIITILALSTLEGKSSKDTYNKFKEKFNGTENSLIYIGRPTCGYCNLLTPSLEDMKKRYEFEYVDINIDEMNNKYLNKIIDDLQITSLGTPYLAIVSNGKVVDVQNGYTDYDKLFEFLQKNNIINSEAELLLNYIGYEEYKDLIKEKENNVIVIGQSTCSYCVKAKVILNEIASKSEIEINYLNLTYLSQEELPKFQSSFEYFQSDSWGTPVTLIVKNGKIIDKLEQLVTEEQYIEFFEKNGVL